MTNSITSSSTAQAFYAEARARIATLTSRDNVIDIRRCLTADLSEAQSLLRFIQDAYNSQSPALTLPGELWLEIAWIVYESCEHCWMPGRDSLLNRFLPLTHICHRLRLLIRSTPNFWTLVDLQSPTAKMVLELSGKRPLSITCNAEEYHEMTPEWPEDQFEEMNGSCGDLPHPPNRLLSAALNIAKNRIESILIVANQEGMMSALHRLSNLELPKLHSLTLKAEGWEDSAFGTMFEPTVHINSPSLRTLHLHGVNIGKGLPPSCFSSLKTLTLSSYIEDPLLFSSISQLAVVLKHCKQLEELHLLNSVQYPCPEAPKPAPVTLNSLRSLTICHTLGMVQSLLKFIVCPELQDLHLRVQPAPALLEDDIPWPVLSAFSFLRQRVQETKTLIVSCINAQVTIGTPSGSWSHQNHTFADMPELGTKVEFLVGYNPADEVCLGRIFDYLFLSEHANLYCESLIIHLDDQVRDGINGRKAWPTIFACLPALRNLHVVHPGHLGSMLEELKPRKGGRIPCPNLENLSLYGSIYPLGFGAEPHWPEIKHIRDAVVTRYRAQSPLKSLQLRTSVPATSPRFQALLKEIKKVIKDVNVAHSLWMCDCVSDNEERLLM